MTRLTDELLRLFDLYAANLLQGANAQAAITRDKFRAVIEAELAQQADTVQVPREVFDWLMGENGEFECPPEKYFRGKPPGFWWRSELRRRIAAAPKSTP